MASSHVKLSLFLVVVALVGLMATADTSCNSVYDHLMPCMGYVTGGGILPPSDTCCSGIKTLKSSLKQPADRQSACRCLKDLGSRYAGAVDFNVVKNLPQKCGVSLPYKISPFHRLQHCTLKSSVDGAQAIYAAAGRDRNRPFLVHTADG